MSTKFQVRRSVSAPQFGRDGLHAKIDGESKETSFGEFNDDIAGVRQLGNITNAPTLRRAVSAPKGGRARSQSLQTTRVVPGRRHVGRIFRVLSNRFTSRGARMKKAATCSVCWSQTTRPVSFVGCSKPDGHAMCPTCCGTYLTGLIKDRRVNDLRCPLFGSDCCNARATRDEVKRYVSAKDFSLYERFLRMNEDPSLRECPVCSELVKPFVTFDDSSEEDQAASKVMSTKSNEMAHTSITVSLLDDTQDESAVAGSKDSKEKSNGRVTPEMKCSKGHVFCYFHSNAHPGITCAEYARAQAKDDRLARAAMGDVKECPGCGLPTLKSEGCNHMVCSVCKTDWCWICGKKLTGVSPLWHYNPSNPFGCLQMTDMKSDELRSYGTCVIRLLALPGTLLGMIAFWAFVPLWVVGGLGLLLSMIVILGIQIVWYLLSFVVYLLVSVITLPCGVTFSALQWELFSQAPITAYISCAELFFSEDPNAPGETANDTKAEPEATV